MTRFPAPLACLVVAVGCVGLQCSQLRTAAPLLQPAGACIVDQLLAGNDDPLTIVAACAGVVVQDVIDVVTTLESQQSDAGPLTSAMFERVRTRAIALGAHK